MNWEFIYEFERRHPVWFGVLIALAIVLVYAAIDESGSLFTHP